MHYISKYMCVSEPNKKFEDRPILSVVKMWQSDSTTFLQCKVYADICGDSLNGVSNNTGCRRQCFSRLHLRKP